MPDPAEGVTSNHAHAVQQRLGEKDWRENVQAYDWVGHLIAEATGLDAVADKRRLQCLIKSWKHRGWLVVQTRRDEKKGKDHPCIASGKPALPEGEDFPA